MSYFFNSGTKVTYKWLTWYTIIITINILIYYLNTVVFICSPFTWVFNNCISDIRNSSCGQVMIRFKENWTTLSFNYLANYSSFSKFNFFDYLFYKWHHKEGTPRESMVYCTFFVTIALNFIERLITFLNGHTWRFLILRVFPIEDVQSLTADQLSMPTTTEIQNLHINLMRLKFLFID